MREQAGVERQRADRLAADALEREAEAHERAQAEKVVAWSDDVDHNTEGLLSDAGERPAFAMRGSMAPAAWILNDSALPITNVNVKWCDPRSGTPTGGSRLIAIIPPRTRRIHLRPSSLAVNDWPSTMPIELEFIDANGRNWRRQVDGQLLRLAVPQ